MLRKLLLSMAVAVCLSAPGLADISQFQDWSIGLGSAINLQGGWQTASDIQALMVSLDQVATQPSGVSALQGITFGQPIQLATTGIPLGGQPFTLDLLHNNAPSGGAVSFVTSLPLYTMVQSLQ